MVEKSVPDEDRQPVRKPRASDIAAADAARRLQALEQTLARLEADNAQLRQIAVDIAEATRGEAAGLPRKLRVLSDDKTRLEAQVEKLTDRVQVLEETNQDLQTRLDAMQARAAKAEKALANLRNSRVLRVMGRLRRVFGK